MRLRSCLAALAVIAAPCALQAGTPHILIKDPSGTPIIVTSNTFTFGADAAGGGVFFFKNESGKDWFSMGVEAVLPPLTSITVTPGPFLSDTIVQTPQGNQVLYDIIFGPVANAIPIGTIFSINLNDEGDDPNGAGSWGPSTDFSARSNVSVSPEPSAVFLLLLGGAAMAGLYCYRRRASLG